MCARLNVGRGSFVLAHWQQVGSVVSCILTRVEVASARICTHNFETARLIVLVVPPSVPARRVGPYQLASDARKRASPTPRSRSLRVGPGLASAIDDPGGPGPASLAVVPVPTGSASRGRPLLENERPGKIRVGQALPVSVVSCHGVRLGAAARKGLGGRVPSEY
jgi:hypothetical protein